MFYKQYNIKIYFLGLVISMLVALNVTSCSCNNSPNDKWRKAPIVPGLTMDVKPKSLTGNKNDIKVAFKLTENNKTADLSKYKLKATLIRSGIQRSYGPCIKYIDANGLAYNKGASFEENISNLVLRKKLEAGSEPLKLKFFLTDVEDVISFKVKFELLDANDKVLNEKIIPWKCNPSDVKFKFEFLPSRSDKLLIGINKTVCFRIQKINASNNASAVDLNKLRLLIRQQSDTSAKVLYKGKEVTELSASDLGDLRQEIVLVVEPNELKETKFVLELEYADIGIVAKEDFTWDIPQYRGEELFYVINNYSEAKFQQVLQNLDINIMANSIRPSDRLTPLSMALYKVLPLSDINTLLQASNNLTINHPDNKGKTSLHHALQRYLNYSSSPQFQQVIQSLLDKGADVNIKDKQGGTPLHSAVVEQSLPTIQKLLNVQGIDVNVQLNENLAEKDAGNTPLHLAIQEENPTIVEMLLKKGARRDIKNTAGKTAVDLAQKSSNQEIKNLFGLTS